MQPLLIRAFTVTTALGRGTSETLDALRTQRDGLKPCQWDAVDLPTWIGEVEGLDAVALRADLADFDCRNNRLAQMALEQDGFMEDVQAAIQRFGSRRVGVFLGSSTSGIHNSELAYRERDPVTGALPPSHDYRHTHNMFSVADFVGRFAGLDGFANVVSTACSSSAKVFGIAQRMIECGLIDAAIVGGVDSLCLTTLYGFNSLQLLSPQKCAPFDVARDGISIGEGAAFILVERADAAQAGDILLTGVGESSDAHHMSAPHPQGLGARMAMQAALDAAAVTPAMIDYVNLHGTATPSNDAAEDKGVSALFGKTWCSSTKGHTGHTLGAAGGVEAVICILALRHGLMPGGVGTSALDPKLRSTYLLKNREQPVRNALSNSFGFGGSNCSLLFSRALA